MPAENTDTARLIYEYFMYQKEVYGNELLLDNPVPEISAAKSKNSAALDEIEQDVRACAKCRLCKTVTRKVFGGGNKNANLVLIGEAPEERKIKQENLL